MQDKTIYRLCSQSMTKCIGYEFLDHLLATIVFVYMRILAKNNKFKLFSELDIILTRINFGVHSPTAECHNGS